MIIAIEKAFMFDTKLTNTLVPMLVPLEQLECFNEKMKSKDDNLSATRSTNSPTELNATASSNSSQELTSLTLGKVIALDEKLEHLLQVSNM